MFKVTEQMRLRIRNDVKSIMHGAHLGHRGLGMPRYLGGDFGPIRSTLHGAQSRLNPVDPLPLIEKWEDEL